MQDGLIVKLQSRKLWVTVIAGAVVAFGKASGLNLDDAQIWAIAVAVAGYVGGQGFADGVKHLRP